MVVCLGWGADLHIAQLMSLPLTVSCSSKSTLVLPFWYCLPQVALDKGPLNGCCCCTLALCRQTVACENRPDQFSDSVEWDKH